MTEPVPLPLPLLHEDRLDYTPTQRSVPLARRRAARLVAEWGQPDLAGDVALVVSELTTNALLHGSLRERLIRVHLTLDRRILRVEVSDPRGERLPRPRPVGAADEQFGRGLQLVGALADRWGWEPRTVGKTVYAEWDVPTPAGVVTARFEERARHAARTREGAQLELIDERPAEKAWPDGTRGRVIRWLTRACLSQRPALRLAAQQGLVVGAHREGRARPDGSLVPSHAFAGAGEWADAAPVLMVVEVTSYDSDTDRRDGVEKPRAYAATGIPVYLLIDRDACEVKVHSRPDGGRYETVQTLPFGKEVALPEPVGIALDTESLKNWVR